MDQLGRPCKVCSIKAAKYTCPQCNFPYCSLPCYKAHGPHCTETFYRTQAIQELRETRATPSDRQRMVEVLARLQDESGTTSSESDSEELTEPGTSGHPILSKATLARLQQQEEQTGTIDVSALHLDDCEMEALGAAAAQGELEGMIAPWQPWWTSADAAELQLNEHGQRMVQGLQGQSMSRLPALPKNPLPRLSTLTKAIPSPLLQWQLVDLLYTYCLLARLFNGEHVQEHQESIGIALEVSPSLAGPDGPHAFTPLQSASQVVLDCTDATLRPSVCGSDARSFCNALWLDTVSLLALGRSVSLCALVDLHLLIRQAHAALLSGTRRLPAQPESRRQLSVLSQEDGQSAEHNRLDMPADSSTNTSRRARRAVQLALRKAWFLLVWVNEQPAVVFDSVHAALVQELASKANTGTTLDGQGNSASTYSPHLILEVHLIVEANPTGLL